MSFESDLLAWAQRQISLPPLRGLPPDQQRRLLQRLLVGAILPRLEAIRPGAAEDPEIREAIRIIPELVVPENEFVLERGLVIVQQASLSIHVGTNLNLEWQGPAPPYSWSNDKHPQGQLSISASTCPGLDSAPTWTGAELLGAQGEYTSRATQEQISAWRMEGIRSSTRYTGLLRLLVEGWGPHENFRKLQPSGWPSWTTLEMGYRGMIRIRDDIAQTYRWYLIYLGPTLGCRAVELTPDASVSCLVDELYSGSLTPQEWIITEAWILRKLALDPTTQEISLITPQEYAQDVIGFTLMHGWKFCHQNGGGALQEIPQADIVVLEYEEAGNENWYNTRHCRVDFDFSGTLTATLSLVEQGKVYFDFLHHPLWEEDTSGLECRTMPKIDGQFSNAPPDLSNNTPVYCVGFGDSFVDLLRYHKKSIVNETGNPGYSGRRLTGCVDGDGDSETWFFDAATVVHGGYSTTTVSATQEIIIGSTIQYAKSFNLVSSGAVIDVPHRATGALFPDCDKPCSPTRPDPEVEDAAWLRANTHSCVTDSLINERNQLQSLFDDNNPEFAIVKEQGAKGTLIRDVRRYDAGSIGGRSVIIPAEESEGIIIGSGGTGYDIERQGINGNIDRDRPVDSWNCNAGLEQYVVNRGAYLGGRVRAMYYGPIDGDFTCVLGPDWHSIRWDSCFSWDIGVGCPFTGPYEKVEDIVVDPAADMRLVFYGNEIQLDPDYLTWKDLLNTTFDNLRNNWNPVIKVQYGGAVIYQEKPELSDIDGIKSNAGFNTQALSDGLEFRFVSS